MASSIYVGNLHFSTTEEDLREHFGSFGNIRSIKLPTDRETNRPRGFGFIEFDSDSIANKAIQLTNGEVFMGRPLRVNMAEPKRQMGQADSWKSNERSRYKDY